MYSVVVFLNRWTTEKQERIYKTIIVVSGLLTATLPFITMAVLAPPTNAVLVDKTFVPSGYMYNWDARQLEQRIERRETRYYFIVRKDDGRIVEERVDSATYVKTDVGERILVD
jgi:hypothetical protein